MDLKENAPIQTIRIKNEPTQPNPSVKLLRAADPQLWSVEAHFPQGQGWQTLEFTLTW
jgi:hypothetical protein